MLNLEAIIVFWILISIPVGFFAASFLSVSQGLENPDDDRIS